MGTGRQFGQYYMGLSQGYSQQLASVQFMIILGTPPTQTICMLRLVLIVRELIISQEKGVKNGMMNNSHLATRRLASSPGL